MAPMRSNTTSTRRRRVGSCDYTSECLGGRGDSASRNSRGWSWASWSNAHWIAAYSASKCRPPAALATSHPVRRSSARRCPTIVGLTRPTVTLMDGAADRADRNHARLRAAKRRPWSTHGDRRSGSARGDRRAVGRDRDGTRGSSMRPTGQPCFRLPFKQYSTRSCIRQVPCHTTPAAGLIDPLRFQVAFNRVTTGGCGMESASLGVLVQVHPVTPSLRKKSLETPP